MDLGNIVVPGTVEAMRPVFWIVMGVSLMIVAWRMARRNPGWTGRLTVAGALLLGFGYAVVLPLPATGLLPARGQPGAELAIPLWNACKLLALNGGWLAFGIGIAMHAKLFHAPKPAARPATAKPTPAPHESVA